MKMNKRLLTSILSILTVLFIVTGCAANNDNNEAVNNNAVNENTNGSANENNEVNDAQIEVEFTISKDDGEEVLETKTIEVDEGAFVLDVLKENFDVEEEGGFVTSIEGVNDDPDNQLSWMYFVNDEMAMVGAAEYELEADDQVTFDLQAWE